MCSDEPFTHIDKFCEKLVKSTQFILIASDAFVALAVVVAKAPYIYESDSSVLVLLQTRMIKCGEVSRYISWTRHCKFTRRRIHFRFRFQNP